MNTSNEIEKDVYLWALHDNDSLENTLIFNISDGLDFVNQINGNKCSILSFSFVFGIEGIIEQGIRSFLFSTNSENVTYIRLVSLTE